MLGFAHVTKIIFFSTHGMANVSQRRITEQLQISPGNLTYHFKKKEDIETALYFALVEEFNALFAGITAADMTLDGLISSTGQTFDLIKKYRFIFLDFAHLMRTNEVVATHYRQLTQIRNAQFKFIFNFLIENDILRIAELPNEYEYLYQRMQILSDFYLVNVEILQDQKDKRADYERAILFLIYPYLTKKGKEVLGNKLNELT
ncbi:MAG: TetR/AcrR family transcriptional regulator [Bacteroidota bacterium]